MLKIFPVLLVLAVLFSFSIAQDTYYIEQTITSSGAMGMGGGTSVQKSWYAQDQIRVESGGKDQGITIIHLDKGMVYQLNPSDKTYFEMQLDQLSAFAKMGMSMMGMDENSEVQLQKTGNSKKIENWNCKEVVVNYGNMKQNMWLSKDVEIPQDYYNKLLKYMPEFNKIGEALIEDKEVNGFPVFTETEMSMMGITVKTTTQLNKVEKVSYSGNMFELPQGYKKVASPLEQMKQRKN